jgi:hypothetical protein
LTVVLPTDLDGGPDVNVQVSVAGQDSLAQVFTISPWLAQIQPIRTALDPGLGNADFQLSLGGKGFGAGPLSARFEVAGAAAVSVPASGGDPLATTTIPATLPNGICGIRLVRADGGVSNLRGLEVLPLVGRPIGLATATNSVNAQVHQLTINGARLNGKVISLNVDDATYQVAPDPKNPNQGTNPAQLVVTLGRLLDPGTHMIAVNVDGHRSRSVPLEV